METYAEGTYCRWYRRIRQMARVVPMGVLFYDWMETPVQSINNEYAH